MARTPLSPKVVELDGPFSHEFIHTRSIRLHAAVAGNPADPLIVLVHGSFGGWFDYRLVIEPLARAGYHVAAVDLRGYGMSDKPPVDLAKDIRTTVGDISGVIQALGHDSAIVAGNDTGAALAWCLATERKERVCGVVSISGAHPVDLRRAMAARPWDFMWILARAAGCRLPVWLLSRLPGLVDSSYQRHLQQNTMPTFRGPVFDDTVELRTKSARIGNTMRGIIWNNRLLTARVPARWHHATVDCPVLFLHADQGLWGPLMRRARRRLTKPLTGAHVPDTKNLPHLENPEGFVAAVLEWARDVPRKAADL